MLEPFPTLDPVLVGQRLVEARKAVGLTQEDAASQLGCSRPVFIAIEKGTRSAKPEEIIKLARLYGRKVHEVVGTTQPVTDWQPHFRTAVAKHGDKVASLELNEAAEALQRFAGNYMELAKMTRTTLPTNYPDEVSLERYRLNIAQLAEDIATRERQRLGLGDQPIADLREIMENAVGIKTLYYPMPSNIAGMYGFIGEAGCCVMINCKHPRTRRRLTAAHEYAHTIVDRHRPGIDLTVQSGKRPPNERFAEIFGSAILLPASGVSRQFNEVLMASGDFQVADLCRMANYYDVSIDALCYRLEGMGLLPVGTMNTLREGKFRKRDAFRSLELAEPTPGKNDRRFPARYYQLAVTAYNKGDISEGQLAKYLDCDPVRAREIVFEMSNPSVMEGNETGVWQVALENTLLAKG